MVQPIIIYEGNIPLSYFDHSTRIDMMNILCLIFFQFSWNVQVWLHWLMTKSRYLHTCQKQVWSNLWISEKWKLGLKSCFNTGVIVMGFMVASGSYLHQKAWCSDWLKNQFAQNSAIVTINLMENNTNTNRFFGGWGAPLHNGK